MTGGSRPAASEGVDVLLVAEPGGHLLEMWAMRDLALPKRRAWCTIDGPDVRSLLAHEQVVLGHGPTCRSIRNLVQNLGTAWRVVRRHRPRVVLCTGSGIVVPFAWVGRVLGARVLYVECGGRVHRPSLSCRMVSSVAHRTYVQWPELVPHVRKAIFCGRLPWERAAPVEHGPRRCGPTLITVGTSRIYPFDRLVGASELIAGSGGVVVQRGSSSLLPAGTRVVDYLSFDELCAEMADADAVVTHGGIGSVLLAMMHGHRPVVMPRRADLGEGVDDHQVHFARRLESEGLATIVDSPAGVAGALRRVHRPGDSAAAGGTREDSALLRRLAGDIHQALVSA